MANEIITRWRMPPLKLLGSSVARCSGSAMPTRASRSTASDAASDRPMPR